MITVDMVKAHLGVGDTADDAALTQVVAAVNAYTTGLPHVGDPWPETVTQGAVMLAARLYRRRNTPSGVESFGDGSAAYVARWDPDVELLLRVGKYAPPRVG